MNPWDSWNHFERELAEEAIRVWMEELQLDYEELNSKYKANQADV